MNAHYVAGIIDAMNDRMQSSKDADYLKGYFGYACTFSLLDIANDQDSALTHEVVAEFLEAVTEADTGNVATMRLQKAKARLEALFTRLSGAA